MAKSAVIVYGEALFSLALEDGNIEERKEEVLWLKQILEESKDFMEFLLFPSISMSQKEQAAENILKEYISKDIMGFFLLLIRKGRIIEIKEILSYFLEKVREYNEVYTGIITSAVSLSEKQKEEIEQKVLDITGYKKIVLKFCVDKSLLGGLIIQIGNRIVDNSVKGKLNQMIEQLIRN